MYFYFIPDHSPREQLLSHFHLWKQINITRAQPRLAPSLRLSMVDFIQMGYLLHGVESCLIGQPFTYLHYYN